MKFMKIKVFILLITTLNLACTHSKRPKKIIVEKPIWLTENCIDDGKSYYFVGYGEGLNTADSFRNATLSSKQVALTCVLGGTINSNIEVSETNNRVQYKDTTKIELNYSHINWSGFERVPDRIFFPSTDLLEVYIQFKWNKKQVTKEQKRLRKLSKKIEENKALKKQVAVSKKIAAEKAALIKAQKSELNKFKKHERELKSLKSKKERVLAKLAEMKKKRNQKGREFVDMVQQMGCDVTYDDLVELIGKPEKIEVRGICFKDCNYESQKQFIPVLNYHYGSYVISSYLRRHTIYPTSDWDHFKEYKSEAEIADIAKVKGRYDSWWICKSAYDFVKERTN